MANRFSTLLTVSAAAVLLTGSIAEAQPHKASMPKVAAVRVHRPVVVAEISDGNTRRPLVIQKRSFLDPGTASTPALGQPEYFASQTTDHQPVYASYNRAFFGESELPRRYDMPYSPSQFGGNNIDFSPLWNGLD